MEKFVIKWHGNFYDCEWSDDSNFEKLNRVLGVHGFVFNENNEICLVKYSKDKHWAPLGGGCEKEDKTFEDTFIREVKEEADLDLEEIKRVGSIHIIPRHNPKDEHYQLRFAARIKKINEQTTDPAKGEISQRIFVNKRDFCKFTGWEKDADMQINKALKKLEEER